MRPYLVPYGLALLILALVVWLGGCASPRERIDHGWLTVAQVNSKCEWQQRPAAFRVRCAI